MIRAVPTVLALMTAIAGASATDVSFYPLGPGVGVKVLDSGSLKEGTLYHGLAFQGTGDLSSTGTVTYADFVTYGDATYPVPTVAAVNADGTVEAVIDGKEVTGFFEKEGENIAFTVASVTWEGDHVTLTYVTQKGLERVTYDAGSEITGPLFPGVPPAVPVGPDEALILLETSNGPLALLLDELRKTAVPTEIDGAFPSPPTVVWDGKVLVIPDGVPVLTAQLPDGTTLKAVTEWNDLIGLVLGSSSGTEAAVYDLDTGSWADVAYLGEVNGVDKYLVSIDDKTLLLTYNTATGEAWLGPYEGTPPSGLTWKKVELQVLNLELTDPSFHGGEIVDFDNPNIKITELGEARVFVDGLMETATLYAVGGSLDAYAALTGDGTLAVVPERIFVKPLDTTGPTVSTWIATLTAQPNPDGTVDVVVNYPLIGGLNMPGCVLVWRGEVQGGELSALASKLGAKRIVLALPSEVAFVCKNGDYYAVVPTGVSVKLDGEPVESVLMNDGKVAVVVETPQGPEYELIDTHTGTVVEKGPVITGTSLISTNHVAAVPTIPLPTEVAAVQGPQTPQRIERHQTTSRPTGGGTGTTSNPHGLPVVPIPPYRRRTDTGHGDT